MIKFFIIRHGSTIVNLNNQIQGNTDNGLIDQGRKTIRKLADNLLSKKVRFDLAVSSGKKRSEETLDIILESIGSPPRIIQEKLNEWHFGSLEGKDVDHTFQNFKSKNLEDLNYEKLSQFIEENDSTGEVESWQVIKERILSAFKDIITLFDEYSTQQVLIVGHGVTIATFLWLIDSKYPFFKIPKNGQIIEVHYEKGKYFIVDCLM